MEPVDVKPLIRRRPRTQTGQRNQTAKAFFVRYYRNGKRVSVKVADKSAQYQTWADVEPLVAKLLSGDTAPDVSTVQGYVESRYLPFVRENKAAVTAYSYERLWKRWAPAIGSKAFATLQTSDVTAVLTSLAQQAVGTAYLSHLKWFMSGVYEYALASGDVQHNPVPSAQWLCKVARKKKQVEYSLSDVMAMLRVLEPVDIRAAVAVALAYFAALRPAEIRGLMWSDYDGEKLHIRRGVWRSTIGDTKTESSASSVPLVIEPLRGLLERLRALYGGQGFILQNEHHKPLSLDGLNARVITGVLKTAGIVWAGFYPARRGISSLITDSSKNALNSTGLLRHSTPVTALQHYTRAQPDSVRAALELVQEMAAAEKGGKETLQ
jgi:integrase